jgi:hypothetical protein
VSKTRAASRCITAWRSAVRSGVSA